MCSIGKYLLAFGIGAVIASGIWQHKVNYYEELVDEYNLKQRG